MRLTKHGVITTAVAIVTVAFVAAFIQVSTKYLTYSSTRASNTCQGSFVDHRVIIENSKVSPEHTVAPRCDTLTIINKDNIGRLIGFGPHDDHVPYDGVAQRSLSKNQKLTVTLVDTGDYRFHDHTHKEIQGTFTVTEQ